MRFLSLSMAALAVAASLSACGGDSKADPVGVNDVRQACEVRRSWAKPTDDKCISCQAAAPTVECSCPDYKDFAGKCQQATDAMKAEPTCTSQIEVCVKTCSVTDCDCIDRCYAQAATCKRAAGSRDGCVAEICAQYCN